MASLTPPPKFQFVTTSGPVSLGKLYTYAAGSDTPLATYTDADAGTENANPVILDVNGSANVWLGSSLYKLVLKTSLDVTVWTVDKVGGGVTLSSLAGTGAGQGAFLIGFIQSGSGAVARTAMAKMRERFSVLDFGAVGDGITDDTAAILAANAAVFAAGGGTLYFPEGTYGVSSLAVDWGTSVATVMWKGDGERSTIIKKIGVTTTPIIDWSITGASDGTYSYMEDFAVFGLSKSSAGIRLDGVARHKMRNVHVSQCDVALDLVGALINSYYDCDLNTNNVGVRTRKNATRYANLNVFFGGGIRSNVTFGLDIGDANGFFVYGTDIENNGTSLNTATGQLIIRDTVVDEIGFSTIRFSGCWFEGGKGQNIRVESASGLTLTFSDVPMISSEAGLVMTVGAISRIVLERITAGTPGDTVTLAASRSTISNSVIHTLADTSANRDYTSLSTDAGTTQFQLTGPEGTMLMTDNYLRSGTGTVATTTGVAATAFAVDVLPGGLYHVAAYINLLGSALYIAAAVVVADGSTARLCSADDGANLTITLSGLNLQVTQTSGSNQTVTFKYLRIA